MDNNQALLVKMVLDAWHANAARLSKLIDGLTDAQLLQPIAPGKNRGIYVVGHLLSVHDMMLPLLGLGDAHYPELKAQFIDHPDDPAAAMPAISDLRQKWAAVHAALAERFNALTPEEWLQRHTAVSAEDFAKEPHRNRLNVLISRTNHLSYHFGQLILVKA
jgi:hypothetical protein